jgi:predicted Zn-dependent peptidase
MTKLPDSVLIKTSNLKNGIQLVTEQQPGRRSVALGIWVKLGSMDETRLNNGISHFYEHMVFKGTRNRTAREIALEIEGRGGYLNAYTTREYTCFYARVAKAEVNTALSVLCDMINEPVLSAKEFKRERGVILEEIRGYDDSADDAVLDMFSKALWQDNAMELPVAGLVSTVKKLKYEQLLEHHERVLNGAQMVVVCVGDVDHASIRNHVKKALPNRVQGTHAKRDWAAVRAAHYVKRRDIQQNHIVMGTALPAQAQWSYSMGLMNVMLGEGMASRLFQKVREQKALAYTVYSNIDVHENNRVFSVYMATDADRGQQAIDVVQKEFALALQKGFTPQELADAKRTILGNLEMSLDTPSSCMYRHARAMVRYNRIITVPEIEKGIEQVTMDDIEQVVQLVFKGGNWASSCIVPIDGPKLHAHLDF